MICIPITARKVNEALEQIKEASKDADIIELRLDYLKELSEKDLKRLLKASKKPVICTCRKIEEGGLFKGTEAKRIGVLKKAMKLKTEYIDLEYGTSKINKEKIHEYNKKHKTKIILSKHYFGYTPEYDDLIKLFNKMKKEKHYALKIITKANTHDDAKIIFLLLRNAKRKGVKLISFCMGRMGRDSRILSMPLGSYLTFASLGEGTESAEGQIPIKDLKKIYSGLRVMF